jgi:peptidoglycan/LPS O-acetylase OafA/YrhL
MTSLAPGPAAWRAGEAAVGCLWVAAALGHLFAWIRRRSSQPSGRASRVLRWGGAVGLPLYVVHQTVLIAFACVVVRSPLPRPAQFAAIAVGALALSTLLAEVARRVMEPKPRRARIGDG